MSIFFNKWLSKELPNIEEFIVDKTKENYYIKYFETEKLSLALNHDWKVVKSYLEEIKSNIREINGAIDSEDYKARSNEVIKAIEESTSSLDENFSKLFNSVIKRMNESAESDEWFSENAKKYSGNIMGAILGMGAGLKSLGNVASGLGNIGKQSSSLVNYGPAPIPTQDISPIQSTAENIAAYSNGGPIPSELKYGPSLENVSSKEDTIDYLDNNTSSNSIPDNNEIQNQTEISNYSNNIGRTIDIPDSVKQTGLCPNYTGYDKFYGKWSKGTMQRSLSEEWGAAGKPSSNGIATLNDRYLVAVSPKFGKVGDNIDIVLKDGQVIKATIADSKGSDATSEWGHVLTKSGAVDIIEWEASGPKSEIDLGSWRNVGVDKIVNLTD